MAEEAWFEKYGYAEDPLTIKPLTDYIIGRKEILHELKHNILSGHNILLSGETGLGKTSVLFRLRKEFGNKSGFRVHYFNMLDGFEKVERKFSKKPLLEMIIERIFGSGNGKTVLLLDEGQRILPLQAEYLKGLFDNNKVFSIVCAMTTTKKNHAANTCIPLISEELALEKLNEMHLKELLGARFQKTNPLGEETVDYIASFSEGNPRQFLINCKKVCIKVHEFYAGEASIPLSESMKIFETSAKKPRGKLQEAANAEIYAEGGGVLANLTPLQQGIINSLSNGEMTMKGLSDATGSSIGTIGKQISLLTLSAKADYMKRKGIHDALVVKNKDTIPTKYSLSESAKELLGRK